MTETASNPVKQYHIQQALGFDESLKEMVRFIRENESITDSEFVELRNIIKLNHQRMKRVYKTTVVTDELAKLAAELPTSVFWLVITDPRCGDSAQSIPVMQRTCEMTDKIELKIIYRDDHPEIMDSFLTDGARAIPKLICLEAATMKVLGTWGPRPHYLQKMLRQHKENPVMSKSEFSEMIQRKYLEDKSITIQKEFSELLSSCRLQCDEA